MAGFRAAATASWWVMSRPRRRMAGPIALLRRRRPHHDRRGKRRIELDVGAAELRRRRKAWRAPKPYATRGVLAKFARSVSSASEWRGHGLKSDRRSARGCNRHLGRLQLGRVRGPARDCIVADARSQANIGRAARTQQVLRHTPQLLGTA
jgi:hypothetical protein